MALSDDFREQLKAGNLPEAFALALSEAVDLKITTWVASAESESGRTPKSESRLHSRINLMGGTIENEVGEQFLDEGPYGELRQFHLAQVAQSSTTIQNNLASLQKLFELMVALRYPDSTPPPVELGALAGMSQKLPAATVVPEAPETEIVKERGRAEFATEAAVSEPLEARVETEAGIPHAPPEPAMEVEPVGEAPEAEGTEETTIQMPPPTTEASVAPPTPEVEAQEPLELEEEEDDDWDDSVLDLLESLPVEPPPTAAEAEEFESEAAREAEEEQQSYFTQAELAAELDETEAESDRDWEVFELADFEPPPEAPETSEEELEPAAREEDRQEEAALEPEPTTREASLGVEGDEDWDDWGIEEPESTLEAPVTELEPLELEEDEDWDELVEDLDPFAEFPATEPSQSEDIFDEDWDEEFGVGELESYAEKEGEVEASESTEEIMGAELESARGDRTESRQSPPIEEQDPFADIPELTEPSLDDSDDPFADWFDEESELPQMDTDSESSMEEGLFRRTPEKKPDRGEAGDTDWHSEKKSEPSRHPFSHPFADEHESSGG
jgi:hypothetical protein